MRRYDKVFTVLLFAMACSPGGAAFPPGPVPAAAPFEHANVRTVNDGYRRTRSQVLVREIDRPTRAALDYAAYHANFMIADPEPERPPATPAADSKNPFRGLLEKSTLTADIRRTPLTDDERRHPVALAPFLQYLQSRHVRGAERLDEMASAVRSESWGSPPQPGTPSQVATEVFVHLTPGRTTELWTKIEFQPWFRALGSLPDQDGDGMAEIYARVPAEHLDSAVVDAMRGEYTQRPLSPAEVKTWANRLSSYWYPSFNTDLMPTGSTWPDERTEADIRRELGGRTFPSPAIVLRGKPQGKATYEIFLVKSGQERTAGAVENARPKLDLPKTRPTPNWQPLVTSLERELAAHGSIERWTEQLAPFDETIRRRLHSMPAGTKALAGLDGFLFYRRSLEFALAGDLEAQRKGKNPLPVIVEFKKLLEAHGVDFLFVPVPTKLDVYPDKLDPKGTSLAGQIVTPRARKFILSLARKGVEVVDLWTPFLAARASSDGSDLLYQHQDTHWTDRGLRMAAELLAARVKNYPWYAALSAHTQVLGTKEVKFTRLGDLHSRLPESEKKKYEPETLVAHQVVHADGTPYDDDPDSPVVVLGDSFTGVYELTDAEHAGVSAHLARALSYPVDLVMSYGGGPNVRQKLMRRGASSLDTKKLVIWIMTARDLYDYSDDWEPLETP